MIRLIITGKLRDYFVLKEKEAHKKRSSSYY